MEAGNQPEGKYRKDYAPPPFAVATVGLIFSLGVGEVPTRVQCKLEVERQPSASGASTLQLDGEDLELLSVALNGQKLSEGAHYTVDSEYLTIMAVPEDEKFTVETEVAIKPHTNFQLSGLYKSSGMFCTQCEAEGFRRITFHQDRPDVMAVYRVRIEADASENPVLLSNGNKIAEGELPGGRHFSEWEDVRRRHPSFLCAPPSPLIICPSLAAMAQAELPLCPRRGQPGRARGLVHDDERPRRGAAHLQRARQDRPMPPLDECPEELDDVR